ncbi:MAG: phosphate ABC transporter ATP-binding protein [Gammaproteobacteria bacterium]|nr:phosphate ABC transporter ATP-binding protein [Gammaproteobacteria bacterium]MCP4474664.1 phosphate ABC transporter ATP-binding protein [Gammaproteobacteria bacterium]
MKSFLQIENLVFHYGATEVLKNVSLSIAEKATTTIIGASGSGKSTLLRCINRIFELHAKHQIEGRIVLQDKNLLDSDVDVNMLRRKIGMVFQKPTPFPMSIFDNVAFALRLHDKPKKSELQEKVERALKRAALWDEVKDKLHQAGTHLSGGQQQRLCLARTIALEPEILLLDEPTSALDPISTASIEKLIAKLKQDFTVLLVTHDLRQAEELSDWVAFMDQGELVEVNTATHLFQQPQKPLTKQYLQNYYRGK